MSQVLIVDDEAGIRMLLQVILEREGYSVETAVDGRDGLRKFRRDPADLVVCDIIMPDMDGLEVIRALKRERPAVDIITISGGGRVDADNYLDLAVKTGARHAFEKPIDRKAFVGVVDDLLASKAPPGANRSTTRSSQPELVAQKAALAAEINLLPLVETLPHCFWVLNRHRQVVLANSASLKILGLPETAALIGLRPGEALGCRNADMNPGGCGSAAPCVTCGALKAITNAQRGRTDTQECQLLQKAGGRALDLRVWANPLTMGDGSCVVFQAQDIAHEKRREALERTFFHDLLNVAGGLQNGLSMLGEMEIEAQAEVLPMLITAGRGLVDEIEAQKDLLAIEEGVYDPKLESFGTRVLLQAVCDCYRYHPVAEGRRLQVDDAISDIDVTSDRRLMTRVLGNMVKNALEASGVGDSVTLGCRAEANGEAVAFWVHNPQHMPEEVQLQVFRRSYSTKGQGRGLGTFSMRLLSERYLQGTVRFASTVGAGTTFTARYPVTIDTIDTVE